MPVMPSVRIRIIGGPRTTEQERPLTASRVTRIAVAAALSTSFAVPAMSQTSNAGKPTWWAKYEYLVANGPDTCTGQTAVKVGPNVDVSNECGPQSETYVTVNPGKP